MRHQAALAIAVVLVLTLSMIALFPGAARAQSTAPAVAHPAASDFVAAVDQYGGQPYGGFQVGLSNGNVYFSAYDPVDTNATVTLTDQNATRDHLTNPVATFDPSFAHSVYNNSYLNHVSYQIPLNLVLGGTWNITIKGTSAGTYSVPFVVHTYWVSLVAGEPAYLADHSGVMYYFINQTVNNAPFTALSSLTLTAQYLVSGGGYATLPGTPKTLSPTSMGAFNFTVPSNVNTYSDIYFQLFANATAGTSGPAASETGLGVAPIGYVSEPFVYLGTCGDVFTCESSYYTNGQAVFALVEALIYTPNGTAPAPGLIAAFQFDSGVSPVTAPGNFPTKLATNGSGYAEIQFIASTSVFSTTATDSVNVSLTDPLDASALYGPRSAPFHVSAVSQQFPGLAVTLSEYQYFGGDTATVSWQLASLNSTMPVGWTVSSWWAWIYSSTYGTSTVVAWGPINSTGTSGTYSFQIPLNAGDEVDTEVSAYNATASIFGYGYASVTSPTLLVSTGAEYFLPGDQVTVQVTEQGQAFNGASMWESVTTSSGGVLLNGAFNGTQFTFNVPSIDAPSRIYVSVSAQTSTLGVIGTASTTMYAGSGIQIRLGVGTASNYADGSYQPGQTISITYQVSAVGNALIPRTFTIVISPGTSFYDEGYGSFYLQETNPSGSIQWTIPSGTPSGSVEVFAYVESNYCTGSCGSEAALSIPVTASPSALQYELGAGSGVTVGWVVLLVLILVVAIVLFLMIRKGRRPVMMAPSSSSAPGAGGSSSPPAGASGGASTGTDSASTSSPPLPEPPKSS